MGYSGTRLLWLTDVHLNQTDRIGREAFLRTLREASFDAAVVTGDISAGSLLLKHLLELGMACDPRPVYFILGNHDFFGSSFADVDKAVAGVCRQQINLHHLGQGEIIQLSDDTALIGHRGWADGVAGYGNHSRIRHNDFKAISDFRGMDKAERFARLKALGSESGTYIRKILPTALEKYEQVCLATHVPPFADAALYNGRRCGKEFLPHFSNMGAGLAIEEVAKDFKNKRVTVLCGHTHHPANMMLTSNISVMVGAAKPGRPKIQSVLNFN